MPWSAAVVYQNFGSKQLVLGLERSYMRPISSMKLKGNHEKHNSCDLQLEEQVPIRGHPLSGSYFRQSLKALASGFSLSLFPVPCLRFCLLHLASALLSPPPAPPPNTHTQTLWSLRVGHNWATNIHTHTHPSVTPFQPHLWVFPDFLVSGFIIIIILLGVVLPCLCQHLALFSSPWPSSVLPDRRPI